MKRSLLYILFALVLFVFVSCMKSENSTNVADESEMSIASEDGVNITEQVVSIENDSRELTIFPQKEEIEFVEGRHIRNDFLSRTFGVYEYKTGHFCFQVEHTYTESNAKDMIGEIVIMLQNTETWLGLALQPVERIVIVQSDAGIENSVYCADVRTVYIHPTSMESGSYVGALYEAVYPQISEMWSRQGLGYLVRQLVKEGKCEDKFRNNIKDFEMPAMLSLFGGYYYDYINEREVIQKAQQIAASLILYVKEKYGHEEMLEWLCGKSEHTNQEVYSEWCSQEWMVSVMSKAALPLWEGVRYGASEVYDIIIYMEGYDYEIIWTPEEAIEIKSVSELENFVTNASLTIETLGDFLEKEVEKSGNRVNRSYFHITIDETKGYNTVGSGHTYADQRRVVLEQWPSNSLAHELVHLYTDCVGAQWIQEGLAEYVEINMYAQSFYQDDNPLYDIRYLAMNEVFMAESKTLFQEYALEYYKQNSFVANDVSTFVPQVYHEGIAYALIMLEDGQVFKLIDEKKDIWYDGGKNYDVFYCFVDYLIEKTSLADVVMMMYDSSVFEHKFGGEFKIVVNEWVEELLENAP